jgi:hypothetical protein
VISVYADTAEFKEYIEMAHRTVKKLPAGYSIHHFQPDWEERLWSLTSELAAKMADRCQEGLLTPKEFGELCHSMAAWTVSTAIEARNPKQPTDEDMKKLFEQMHR